MILIRFCLAWSHYGINKIIDGMGPRDGSGRSEAEAFPPRHSGARAKRASPESITPAGSMDSGPAPSRRILRCAIAHRGMTDSTESRQRILDEACGPKRAGVVAEAGDDLHTHGQAAFRDVSGNVDAGDTHQCPEPVETGVPGRGQTLRRGTRCCECQQYINAVEDLHQ